MVGAWSKAPRFAILVCVTCRRKKRASAPLARAMICVLFLAIFFATPRIGQSSPVTPLGREIDHQLELRRLLQALAAPQPEPIGVAAARSPKGKIRLV
jgi:hypothetical protein